MQLKKLSAFADDPAVLQTLLELKHQNKAALAQEILQREGIRIDPDSVYDIQIKRLHEYKRQQMNALYAIWKYFQIKQGILPKRPITMIFGAKAAPAYTIAKDIIHLILCLQQLFASDPEVDPYLKIVMVENYNVSYAEKLTPACDISEQIYYYCCHSQLLPIDNKTLDFQKWNQIVMIGSGQIGSSHDFRKKQEVTQKQQISSEQNPSKT